MITFLWLLLGLVLLVLAIMICVGIGILSWLVICYITYEGFGLELPPYDERIKPTMANKGRIC